jgi:acyl dehydratase
MFARAVGDPNPLFVDAERARAAGHPDVIAPPTFGIAADHFDPDYERRPRAGETWFGSGAEPISVTGGSQQPSGGGSGFHAEEQFVYHRPIVVGDLLFGHKRPGRSWQKLGRRGGRLRFSEDILEYRDAADVPVLTAVWVNVATEHVVTGEASEPVTAVVADAPTGETGKDGVQAAASTQAVAASTQAVAASAQAVAASTDWMPRPDLTEVELSGVKLAVGEAREQLLVEDLKRTQIVMYAGASGDFHPMHTDASYARAMGMPGVFAHGMLTMGIAARALTDLAGAANLADYRSRFQGQVWPGDTLRARTRVVAVCERAGRRAARLEIVAFNQRGESVLAGHAHAWLET